ncbi:DJ-1 family glyoxalase III [Oribacterium sp. FC2011]|uniref:DJ-1 family glyoxalase III n=1 Tax=Oribacterium sp. FC2011 TaxID=1408311 RepID=UPI000AD84419|nr:DJ-1 family glyoxalase III [Oribacterium sp. FC2011]
MNIAVILAGGVGNRVGAGIPKQFIEVLGKPVLAYTIEAFENHPEIDATLVVCVKSYIDYMAEMKEKYRFKKLRWVTEGGDTFQKSVLNGINFLEDKIDSDDTVLVHFGASPFITADIISDCIRVCKEKENAISTTDYYLLCGEKKSTKSVADLQNYSDKYINRDTIAIMNTPHAFRYEFIRDLYREAIETGIINTVEPHTTTLMYAMGKKIYFSLGSQNNIKITRKEDLELFEGYVLERYRKEALEKKEAADVVVFMADGFEECEGLLVVDILRRAGLRTVMASVMGRIEVDSSRHIEVKADCLAENVDYSVAKMIVLPGGRIGTENLAASEFVKEKCIDFGKNKIVAAVCAAPSILASLGLMKKATVHPDFVGKMCDVEVLDKSVVVDDNIITGQGLGAAIPFALEIVKKLEGDEKAKQIRTAICYRG